MGYAVTLTNQQIHTAQAITNVFETGRPRGDYSRVAVLPDGAGISYGRSQATERSGTLERVLHRYVHLGGKNGHLLAPWFGLLGAKEPLHDSEAFKALLVKLGNDPVMRVAQDEVFTDGYWNPAQEQGIRCGLEFPLSYAILYDIHIQSGAGRVGKLRRAFAEVPPSKGGAERDWAMALNSARFRWLATHSRKIVRATTYRPETYSILASTDRGWHLELPLRCRGMTIGEEDIA